MGLLMELFTTEVLLNEGHDMVEKYLKNRRIRDSLTDHEWMILNAASRIMLDKRNKLKELVRQSKVSK